ncbi:UNVERIFIED_CONTAM: hypothetical protein HDU68_008047 [Siphonaria sp. JEL0065]|nr:hypothetical protein HDU68_008047 [Siphonaria sp. JEL0065]
MLATAVLFIATAIATHAAPIAAPVPAVLTGCKVPKQSTLAFRTLDFNILGALAAQNQTATFFVDPLWVRANPFITQQAVVKGHTLGLAIPDAYSLVNTGCFNCDFSVNQAAVDAFFTQAIKDWSQQVGWMKSSLNLVSFVNEKDYKNLIYSHMRENKFNSLEQAIVKKGFSPVLASFGADSYIFESASEHNVVLSNIIDSSAIFLNSATSAAVNNYYLSRANITNLEDVSVVLDTVKFLGTNGKTIVPAAQCFGF